MGEDSTLYVGLDVHKQTIAVALAEDGATGEVRVYGTIANSAAAVDRLLARLSRPGRTLHLCYEAGPCGYALYRQIRARGHDCVVVAPALIPKRPGERVKTDRRDARKLARLLRAGELTPVWVPEPAHEAMRDLVRARMAAVADLRRARQRLTGFLLRQGRIYAGRHWTARHARWLAAQSFAHPAQQIVFAEYRLAVDAAQARIERLTTEIAALVPAWSLAPLVAALQALRGVSLIIAATLAAEIGDVTRFAGPRPLMAYLGLVPSEHSSGPKRRQGGITKAGNTLARRLLVEAAWAYRWPARVGPALTRRQAALPAPVRALAWKAQTRLCARYRALVAAGKKPVVAVVALARELLGFIWAIARQLGRPAPAA